MPAVKTGTGPWGEAIKYWLPRKNMRNADLARATGIEEKTIGKMARGFHTTTRKLEAVALAFDVPLEDVLVSPERQRKTEFLGATIRDAVAAALRAEQLRHQQIGPGRDELQRAFEAQATAEEQAETRVKKKIKHKPRRRKFLAR